MRGNNGYFNDKRSQSCIRLRRNGVISGVREARVESFSRIRDDITGMSKMGFRKLKGVYTRGVSKDGLL